MIRGRPVSAQATADTVADWAGRIRGQLEQFVGSTTHPPARSRVENNLSWTADCRHRLPARCRQHFSVNVMPDRDTSPPASRRRRHLYTDSATCLLQANDYVGAATATAAVCRSAAPTSGATSSPGCDWSARSWGAACARADHAAGDRFRRARSSASPPAAGTCGSTPP